MASEISQRFELQPLHSAHPLFIGSLLDPWFKKTTLSRFKDESDVKDIKHGLIDLMQMVLEQTIEDDTTTLADTGDSVTTTTSTAAKKQKLTALDKLLGPEQLSQESLTLENELEKYLAEPPIQKKKTLLCGGKLILLGLKHCQLL